MEISAFIEGGNFHYKVNSIMDSQNRPFSSFCSFDTLNDADNTSPICEKQPLSHFFFLNKYVIHSYLAKYFINNTKGFDRKA